MKNGENPALSRSDFVQLTVVPISANSFVTVTQGATLQFTPTDWDNPKTVTFNAASDTDSIDSANTFQINAGGLAAVDVSVVEVDQSNFPQVDFLSASQTVEETAGSFSIDIVLSKVGLFDISVPITISGTAVGGGVDYTETSLNPLHIPVGTATATAVFTPNDDDIAEGTESISLSIGLPVLGNPGTALVHDVTLTDDDIAGVTTSPASGDTTEGSGIATFTVVLDSEPLGDVTISLASNDSSEGFVSDPVSQTITFTNQDWTNPQTVTVRGINDPDDDGDVSYQIGLVVASVTDPLYDALGTSLTLVDVINIDNDITLTVNAVSEGQTTPQGPVVLDVDADMPFTISAAPGPGYDFDEWSGDIGDVTNPFAANTSISTGVDTYLTPRFSPSDRSIVVDANTIRVPEGGTATFRAKLSAIPIGTTFISTKHATGDTDLSVVSGDVLEFNTSNWDQFQTVEVAAEADADGTSDSAQFLIAATAGLNPIADLYITLHEADTTADTDGDTLTDAWEVDNNLDPANADEDGNGTADGAEDFDNDGLTNGAEQTNSTHPNQSDSDGDGLSDGDEVLVHTTDPLSADTDGDSLPDNWEISNNLSPTVGDDAADPDEDGLDNAAEFAASTDPNIADTDNDGLTDGFEVNQHNSNPTVVDTDADGIYDKYDTTPATALSPVTHPLYFDQFAKGFSFPIEVDDDSPQTQLNGLINFGDAVTPYPQKYDPLTISWTEATQLKPNIGYLAYALDIENADSAIGRISNDFVLDLSIGLNLIAMPMTTNYPADEPSVTKINADDNGNLVLPELTAADNLEKNKLYWIDSNAAASLDTRNWITDIDADNMPDPWEQIIIDDNTSDSISTPGDVLPTDDYDGDGLSNYTEFRLDTDPSKTDSDGDTMTDAWEANFGLNSALFMPAPQIWWKLNESPGASTAANSQSGQYSGTITNPDTFIAGLFDNSISLQSNTRISLTDSSNLNTWTGITLSLWLKSSATLAGAIIGRDTETSTTIFALEADASGNLTMIIDDQVSNLGILLTDNQWHHVMLSIDPAFQATIYMDGKREYALTLSTALSLDGGSSPLLLGAQNTTTSLVAAIDDVRIFNVPLNLSHADQLYRPLLDSDTDGLTDLEEFSFGSYPDTVDSDGDGLSDFQEYNFGSLPLNVDTDSDGLTDSFEAAYDGNATSYDPRHPISNPAGTDTDLRISDTDQDGLTDGDEGPTQGRAFSVKFLEYKLFFSFQSFSGSRMLLVLSR